MNIEDIKINEHYIVTKNNKSQYVLVDNIYENKYINYSYGFISSHEGYCNIEEIRNLTAEEKKLTDKSYLLPQQFYQAF